MHFEQTQILMRLAYNFRWAWHAPTVDLFCSLAPDVWNATHNPAAVMRAVAEAPDVLAAHADRLVTAGRDLEVYMTHWPEARLGGTEAGCEPEGEPEVVAVPRVAYFSAEFAITECLPIYSGGLGVLAGDHLKAASDLGMPVIGIGLLYRYGYFRQTVDTNGEQHEVYDRLDPDAIPLHLVTGCDGMPLMVGVPLSDRTVVARAWMAQVGRVRLYLLDTDLPRNRSDDRWITGHLYGGDRDTRLRQEIVLGIGGARLIGALRVLGLETAPEVYHLNEGHSAFAAVELAADRMRTSGISNFFTAHQQQAERVAFTTHTPVSAGHDSFPAELIEAHLATYRVQLGLSRDEFMALGRRDPGANEEPFSMTVLALRSAHARNGVSQLHGVVSQQLWSGIGVGVGVRSVQPRIEMEAITNGVHTATWAGPEMGALFDRYLGCAWRTEPQELATWLDITRVDAEALWAARTAQRARLLERIIGLSPSSVADQALVIGFARRFATYKRAGLLLRDPERLARLLDNPERPVVLVFAGKAHPHDEPGKRLVKQIVEATRDPHFRGRLLFLANYDVERARLLVQGSDVWLNTPRQHFEASGTSGMKAALNGALNVSELDGWWDEAYAPGLGWALGERTPDNNIGDEARDWAEASQLMDLLENEIVPMYSQRDDTGRPQEWLARVQRSIKLLAGAFSAHRMVDEYVARIYCPLASGPAFAQDVRTTGIRESRPA